MVKISKIRERSRSPHQMLLLRIIAEAKSKNDAQL